MAWSTRELADLAGTTVNTVRHYHRADLLEEPERRSNGYKQYGAEHLIRLLQIRRLRDLGVPLAQIRRTEAGVEAAPGVLEALDAELVETIRRSEGARSEIADLLEHGSIATMPPGFATVAQRLSPADRAMVLVYAQLYRPAAMDDVRSMMESTDGSADAEFESLPEDADEQTRERLTLRLAAEIEQAQREHPWILEPVPHLQHSTLTTAVTAVETMRSLYHEAQLEVLSRAAQIAQERLRADPPGSSD